VHKVTSSEWLIYIIYETANSACEIITVSRCSILELFTEQKYIYFLNLSYKFTN